MDEISNKLWQLATVARSPLPNVATSSIIDWRLAWKSNETVPQSIPRPEMLPFIGEEVDVGYDNARVVILPIPYEATTTYRVGCQHGPAALLAASDQLEYYDVELGRETCFEVGIHTHAPIADTRQGAVSEVEMLAAVREAIARCVNDGKFVVSIGGEHSITAGVVAGYRQALGDDPFTVVQIDAHGDLRTEYEGSRYNHACVMHRVLELGCPSLPVGIRSICREEAELIRARNIPVFWDDDIAGDPNWIDRAIDCIGTEKVFLTVDLDGLDPSLVPGVGTPQPGGLGWHTTLEFLRRLCRDRTLIGADIMELCPVADSVVSEFTAAKLTYKIVGYREIARSRQGASIEKTPLTSTPNPPNQSSGEPFERKTG
ncbi:Agmatinase [Geitlerinema sp. FC II]|nr:Agmatinase [Geitlerinema sp. FC II]